MTDKDLNIKYICERTLLDKDDKLVPIILDMIQESYKAGLCQAEYDNTMELMEENKQLKEQLSVTQTNEETFRLEMDDITQALGLDEHTLFDDVKVYARNLKYNWNELKKWLYEDHYLYVPEVAKNSTYHKVLEKMKEMERN